MLTTGPIFHFNIYSGFSYRFVRFRNQTMRLDSILGKIISLTKEIHFSEPPEGNATCSSFLTGSGNPHIPFGNLGLQWWYTKKADRLLTEIAKMVIVYDPQLSNGDRAEFSSIISKTLQHNVLHCGIFDGSLVFFRKKKLSIRHKNRQRHQGLL